MKERNTNQIGPFFLFVDGKPCWFPSWRSCVIPDLQGLEKGLELFLYVGWKESKALILFGESNDLSAKLRRCLLVTDHAVFSVTSFLIAGRELR